MRQELRCRIVPTDWPIWISMIEQEPSRRLEELIRERARLDVELERCKELVTVLFVDIVGSTRFYDEHGDVATASLLEVWIDEAERRVWFLFEAGR